MQVSPDSSMGSSSNDMVMTAMPAVQNYGSANDAAFGGVASGADELRTGRFLFQTEFRQLQNWAQQFKVEAERRSATSEAQVKHMTGGCE